MYPGLPFIDGLYTVEDLPDSIVITINSSEYTLSKTGDTYPDAIYSGSGGGFVIEIYSGWRVYLNPGQEDEQFFDFNCLISNSFVPGEGATASVTKTEDQFADSYTITYLPTSISVTVSRIFLCVWRGNDACGRPWYLIYGDSIFGAGSPLFWHVAPAIDDDIPCETFQQQPQPKNSDEFNNTPVGNYTQSAYPCIVS
jgi:hypothetical protein